MNILEKANEIVNERSEEKARQYGPFGQSLEKTAELFNLISDVQLTAEHAFKVLIALKLSREAWAHKEDNLLDAVAYIGALNNYLEEKKKNNEG